MHAWRGTKETTYDSHAKVFCSWWVRLRGRWIGGESRSRLASHASHFKVGKTVVATSGLPAKFRSSPLIDGLEETLQSDHLVRALATTTCLV